MEKFLSWLNGPFAFEWLMMAPMDFLIICGLVLSIVIIEVVNRLKKKGSVFF